MSLGFWLVTVRFSDRFIYNHEWDKSNVQHHLRIVWSAREIQPATFDLWINSTLLINECTSSSPRMLVTWISDGPPLSQSWYILVTATHPNQNLLNHYNLLEALPFLGEVFSGSAANGNYLEIPVKLFVSAIRVLVSIDTFYLWYEYFLFWSDLF